MLEESYCELKGDLFNLKKLHHLRMVHSHLSLKPNTYYWMVYSPNGVVLSNWKTKVKVLELQRSNLLMRNGSFSNTNTFVPKEVFVYAECEIMDGNYSFRQYYDYGEYTFFEYE